MNILTIASNARALHKAFAVAAILGLLFGSLAYLAMPMSVSADEHEGGQSEALDVNGGEVDYCDPSQKPGGMSIGEWLAEGEANGADCFNYEVDEQSCGMLDVAFSENQTPYDYTFHYVLGTNTPELANWEGDGELPVNFSEDEHGGSVEVTYYVVGPESEYFEGFGIPNIWDGNGETVTVDTDCERPVPEPSQCEIGENLLANGGFETPEVTHDADWDIFTNGSAGVEWVVTWFTDNFSGATPGGDGELELHRGVSGWTPDEGAQYAELDSDTEGPDGGTSGEEASVMISQTVNTNPGATYELSWNFSPRPDTGASDNILEVLVDGTGVATNTAAGGGNTAWTEDSHTFEAGENVTVAFRDAGEPNSEGTFLDNVALCLIEEPNGGGDDDGSIFGAKWNDHNGDSEPGEGESGLAGWVIQLFAGGEVAVASTTTDGNGNYSFTDLADGEYTVCEVQQEGWKQTYPATTTNNGCHDVTIDDGEIEPDMSFDFGNQEDPRIIVHKVTNTDSGEEFEFSASWSESNFFLTGGGEHDSGDLIDEFGPEETERQYSVEEINIPSGWTLDSVECVSSLGHEEVAEAINLNIGEVVTCTFTNTEEGGGGGSSTSGGGGGGERIELTERDPDPDDEDEPEGEVLGEQTSVVPAGAPDTGAGGTSGGSALPLMTLITMAFAALGVLRVTRSHA